MPKKSDIITNLFKIPHDEKRGVAPSFQVFKKGYVQQADVLFMPWDGDNETVYKYILVVIDVGNRKLDAEALKTKSSQEVAKAFGKIYNRGILSIPKSHIEVDSGSEFKGQTLTYFKNKQVRVRVGLTGRHKQQGVVERANQTIARKLFMKMAEQELITGEINREWKKYLPDTIKQMNLIASKNLKHQPKPKTTVLGEGELLKIGDMVRIPLDYPRMELVGREKLPGRFRSHDIRYNKEARIIKHIMLKPNQPPMYLVNDAKDKNKIMMVGYTRKQLQLVDPDEIYPQEFEIEKVILHKLVNRKILFKIKWKGYPLDDATFEPIENLKDSNGNVLPVVKRYLKQKKLI